MIELPFPAKILWPNGRGHHMKKHRLFQDHKRWAMYATIAAVGPVFRVDPGERVKWTATFYPKTRNRIDHDNAVASLKAYQDGIAQALRIDDAQFDTPTIHFAEPVKNGRVVIVIGEGATPLSTRGSTLSTRTSASPQPTAAQGKSRFSGEKMTNFFGDHGETGA